MNQSSLKPLVLYFHVHQPQRLKRIGFLDIGSNIEYFDDQLNSDIIKRIAARCYIPVNKMLTKLCKQLPGVRLTFSISGIVLTQLEKFAPEAIDSFKELIDTGCVELLGETSHHTLACLMPGEEFASQVKEHSDHIERIFNVRPSVFRNTELVYDDRVGSRVAQLGFKGIICDDVDRVLKQRSRNAIYRHPSEPDFKILLRNNTLSDDIGFRFTNDSGKKLELETYFKGVESVPGVVTLAFDYETFGEHMPESTGIIDFLKGLIEKAVASSSITMMTPSDVFKSINADEALEVTEPISWADENKDLSAWLDNEIQNEAFKFMQGLEESVRKSGNVGLLETWRNLQTSDHFYYMSAKQDADGEVHSYFSPYESPYEAYINYMNILNDFKLKLQQPPSQDPIEATEYERRHEHVPVWAEKAQATYHELTSR